MMTYVEMMERCLRYIEEHLQEDISPQDLADLCGYSLHHFCHVFTVCNDCSVGEYIRRQRMQKAGQQLRKGGRVTEVAREAGFDTISGFSRAFKKEFGLCASAYRYEYSGEGISVAIRRLPPQEMAGYPIFPADAQSDSELIGAYWHGGDFHEIDAADYAAMAGSGKEIGLWEHPSSATGELCYFYGPVIAKADLPLPEGMFHRHIPGGYYAVFTTAPADLSVDNEHFAAEIRRCWRYIYSRWLDENGIYTFRPGGVAYEFYSADYGALHDQNVVMNICIPVKRLKK